jgi:hypothetical protein
MISSRTASRYVGCSLGIGNRIQVRRQSAMAECSGRISVNPFPHQRCADRDCDQARAPCVVGTASLLATATAQWRILGTRSASLRGQKFRVSPATSVSLIVAAGRQQSLPFVNRGRNARHESTAGVSDRVGGGLADRLVRSCERCCDEPDLRDGVPRRIPLCCKPHLQPRSWRVRAACALVLLTRSKFWAWGPGSPICAGPRARRVLITGAAEIRD